MKFEFNGSCGEKMYEHVEILTYGSVVLINTRDNYSLLLKI